MAPHTYTGSRTQETSAIAADRAVLGCLNSAISRDSGGGGALGCRLPAPAASASGWRTGHEAGDLGASALWLRYSTSAATG